MHSCRQIHSVISVMKQSKKIVVVCMLYRRTEDWPCCAVGDAAGVGIGSAEAGEAMQSDAAGCGGELVRGRQDV